MAMKCALGFCFETLATNSRAVACTPPTYLDELSRGLKTSDDLQLLLNRQARSTLGALPTTPRSALMRDSGLTSAAVALDARQQRFVARLANACEGSKSKELYDYPTSGAPVGRVAAIEHARRRRAETMCWPAPGEEPAVKTTILDDDAAAKRAAERWAREKEGKSGSGAWVWWTDGSQTDDGRVGATAVCLTETAGRSSAATLARDERRCSTLNYGQSEPTAKVRFKSGGTASTRSHDSGGFQ